MLRTPFYLFHKDHGARFVDFAGWEMPITFGSIHDEHQQVRTSGGMFDVSHMGRIKVRGRHSRRLLERILTRRISTMPEDTCRYSLICNERGGVLDDVVVYRFDGYWMLVVNAANREKVLAHLHANTGDFTVRIEDITESTAMVALQGPRVMEHISRFSREVPALKRYSFCTKNLLFLELIISRTGYTGEDGIEVIMPANVAPQMVKLLLAKAPLSSDPSASAPSEDGQPPPPLAPCGLGARDTLRLEAGMPLYGHELSEQIDPFSAGLAFAVNLDKDQDDRGEAFIGIDALKKIVAQGPRQKRVGLKLQGKRTARQGMTVSIGGKPIGTVTSGGLSPTLGYPIAMAYLDTPHSEIGGEVTIRLGTQQVPGQVVPLPFYKRR